MKKLFNSAKANWASWDHWNRACWRVNWVMGVMMAEKTFTNLWYKFAKPTNHLMPFLSEGAGHFKNCLHFLWVHLDFICGDNKAKKFNRCLFKIKIFCFTVQSVLPKGWKHLLQMSPMDFQSGGKEEDVIKVDNFTKLSRNSRNILFTRWLEHYTNPKAWQGTQSVQTEFWMPSSTRLLHWYEQGYYNP